MTSTPEWQLDAIEHHSAALADVAVENLDLDVLTCPGWTMADLVQHVSDVQWFWATIVSERLTSPPDESARPSPVGPGELVETFRCRTSALVAALRDVDSSQAVWTWASQKDVGFVSRHQVQEAAVHNFDAAFTAGALFAMKASAATDAVEEFLTFSIASADDPKDDSVPALSGPFNIICHGTDVSWTIDTVIGTNHLTVVRGRDHDAPSITAPPADLLLWLYGRREIPGIAEELVTQFRALCWTS
jgi:uncharacterized protein (TIGR03083 family)